MRQIGLFKVASRGAIWKPRPACCSISAWSSTTQDPSRTGEMSNPNSQPSVPLPGPITDLIFFLTCRRRQYSIYPLLPSEPVQCLRRVIVLLSYSTVSRIFH